jgi:hypothetical protein
VKKTSTITQVAANRAHTVGVKNDGTVVATAVFDFESALAKWNLLIVGRPINWPLIGVIIAGVVAIVLVILGHSGGLTTKFPIQSRGERI